VTRRPRTIAVVSLVGGAASVLPFAAGWFGLSTRAANVLLFAAVVCAFGFSLAIGAWPALREGVDRLAGPPDRPARALVLVALAAGAGAGAMVAASALVGAL
jgi:hypothetical protein